MTVVAITGTPATGKTTVAALVGKKLNWKVIDLNELAHQKELYSGYDEERQTHVVDLDKIQDALDMIFVPDLIIESHYAHEMKCDYAIVLRVSPDELRERARDKGWTRKKTEENVLAEIMEVCKHEAMEAGKKVLEVDTTGKTPARISLDISRMIRKLKKLQAGGKK